MITRRKFLRATVAGVGALAVGSQFSPSILSLFPRTLAQPSSFSSIYCIGGFRDSENGRHVGLQRLFTLMGSNGLRFYKSQDAGSNKGPDGLIAKNDTVLIKVNCQWVERGGTNTDLVKEMVQTILDHPEGFTGEIVVVDNGQGRGSFTWTNANAEDTSQNVQKVVDPIAAHEYKVSTFLWDNIRTTRTEEYDQSVMNDGYVLEDNAHPSTGMRFNYPKFRTSFGTYVSLKKGVWNPDSKSYSSERLKLINFPILKSHGGAGVTACIKHYMGVISQSIQDNHPFIWNGGLTAEMSQIRFPTLNVLDAIYVNPHPMENGNAGPNTPYASAVKTNKIAAGLDPVAIDYWASKNILLPVARD